MRWDTVEVMCIYFSTDSRHHGAAESLTTQFNMSIVRVSRAEISSLSKLNCLHYLTKHPVTVQFKNWLTLHAHQIRWWMSSWLIPFILWSRWYGSTAHHGHGARWVDGPAAICEFAKSRLDLKFMQRRSVKPSWTGSQKSDHTVKLGSTGQI